MYKFLAPVLSAQFITDATGSEFVIFSLIPLRPPLPVAAMKEKLKTGQLPELTTLREL
jgi:hypothetical protein